VTISDADLRVEAGSSISVSGRNFAATEQLTLTLYSAPVRLGTVTTDPQGTFDTQVTIPTNTEAGAHRIVVSNASGDVAEIAFTVVASGNATSALANTGVSSLTPMLGGALALLAAGAGALVIRRRQQRA
jgi:LPXTG-motif cell wall-anchored protein